MNNNISITEELYPSDKHIDHLDIKSAFNYMLDDHLKVFQAIKKSKNDFIKIIKFLISHLSNSKDGRLIYCGAGTSARIGVQDGVELYPTFGWPLNRVDFIIAGGKDALMKSIENSEDNINEAAHLFKKKKINSDDFVIGLAASGNTQFTNEILKLSSSKKALTIAISNNPNGFILDNARYKIILNTKEEVVAGSTRLKAGTAQKVCLNIISTLVMTQLGGVKKGMMINMIPKNEKLRQRAKLIKKKLSENHE